MLGRYFILEEMLVAQYIKEKSAMGDRIQFDEAQAAKNRQEAKDAAATYNKLHLPTKMIVRELPGGNVQIVVVRREERGAE